jgi:DNA polymerase III delta subunit
LQGENAQVRPADLGAKRKLAARLGHEGLTKLFRLLFLADLSVKSGARREDQALDSLVADVSLLLAATSPTNTPATRP